MPTIVVQGRPVSVSDGFFRLSPEEQSATVNKIAEQMTREVIAGTAGSNVVRNQSPPDHSWSELPGNIGPSAVNTATDLWDMITHPERTAEGLVDAAQGGVDRIMPEEFTNFMDTYVSPRSPETKERQRLVSGAVGQALKDRYWGLENLKRTMITDPVGSVLDVAGIATGVGGLVRGSLAAGSKARLFETPSIAMEGAAVKKLGQTTNDDLASKASDVVPTRESGLEKDAPKLPEGLQQDSQGIGLYKTASGSAKNILKTDRSLSEGAGFTVPKPAIPGHIMFWERSSPWIVSKGPFSRPHRPFSADYPNGTASDDAGKLLFDIENRPLTAKRIAGRRELGGRDQALMADDILALVNDMGAKIQRVPQNKLQTKTAYGDAWFHVENGPELIRILDTLPEDQAGVALGHEAGHMLDFIGNETLRKAPKDELERLYAEAVTGRREFPHLPQMGRYTDEQAPFELAAEAGRVYMTQPNTIKTIAPKTAALLRTLNSHPFFRKYLQFNNIPLGAALGAGAVAIAGHENKSQARESPQRDFRRTTADVGSSVSLRDRNIRKIAAALQVSRLAPPIPVPEAFSLASQGFVPQARKLRKWDDLVRALLDLRHRQRTLSYGGRR